MKIILDYDASTGQLTDFMGVQPIAWTGLSSFPPDEDEKVSPGTLIKLKEAGFTADDIVTFSKSNLI